MAIPARLIYDAYPDSDLLPIRRPRKNESLDAWMVRTFNPIHCGDEIDDTLYLFICRELREPCLGLSDAIFRLESAREDIDTVLLELEKLAAAKAIDTKRTAAPRPKTKRRGR